MIILAYMLLMAVLLGSGTLVASMIPTDGARIGLGAVVFLALVVDVTWLIAPLAGWSALLGDGVWIGVLALVAFGAWSTALAREGTSVPDWTWPGWRDLAFLLLAVAVFGAVLIVLPVPLDTDAQGFGYLALLLRESGEYTTLAPWYPQVDYLYAPGFLGVVAHLSARFDVGLHDLQFMVGAAAAALFVWTAHDLGCELGGPRTGRGLMLAALLGTGLSTAFMDSHFTAVLALLFSLGFVTFVLRFLKTERWSSALLAALCLAAVPLSQPDTTIALIIGYGPWLLVVWLARPRPSLRAWLIIAAVIPLVALGLVAPWLLSLEDLLGSGIESPFEVATNHWREMVLMHGVLIVVVAALGALTGLVRRSPAALWMLVWLVAIVEFALFGVLEDTFPTLIEPLLKYDYPFSLAWHGPIIPYVILGGLGLVWLADWLGGPAVDQIVAALAPVAAALGVAGVVALVAAFDPLLHSSKDVERINFFGAFSSEADVAAMEWLRDNAPVDARVLNHPGPHEGDWVPVISERDTVFFRPQPFFRGTDQIDAEQERFRAFWQDPTDPDHWRLFSRFDVRYVIVPQVFMKPASFDDMVRWREPLPEAQSYAARAVADADYLQLVFEDDGAQVYEVLLPAPEPDGNAPDGD